MRSTNLLPAAACLAAAGLFGPAAPLAYAQQGASTATAAAAPASAITLAPKFKKDDVHKYVYHVERTDALTMGDATTGAPPTTAVTIDANMSLKVVEASDAGVSFELTVDTLKVDATNPTAKYAFQNGQPEDDKDRENMALMAFKPLMGMVLKFEADKSGVIASVSGQPAIPQGSLASVANQYFTNTDYLKYRWNNVLHARRDHAPMAVGQSWPQADTFVAPQVGKFELSLNSTLKAVNVGVASIDSVGDMKLVPAKEGDTLAFALKDTSILATSTWNVADGMSKTFEMQRNFTLQGDVQGLKNVVRTSREKYSFTRVMP